MLKTPLCDLLGIEKPVFQGGMAWDWPTLTGIGRIRGGRPRHHRGYECRRRLASRPDS